MLDASAMQAEVGRLQPRIRIRMWVLTAAVVVWAGGYLVITIAQGSLQDWWGPGWYLALALIPAGLMAIALRGRSPRALVVATSILATWAAILGVLGLVSLIGAPLLLVGAVAYQALPTLADGEQGRPDWGWGRRVLVLSGLLGLLVAFVALVTTIISTA